MTGCGSPAALLAVKVVQSVVIPLRPHVTGRALLGFGFGRINSASTARWYCFQIVMLVCPVT